jgi:NAD(P)-dependent dehydrogenase (short-subunit alcohol dehydrogenase family)
MAVLRLFNDEHQHPSAAAEASAEISRGPGFEGNASLPLLDRLGELAWMSTDKRSGVMNSAKIRSVLITGANAGIGKEIARQLASNRNIETINLACRNKQRALTAKQELEAKTKRSIFKIVIIDVSDNSSVRAALATLPAPVDALIMNAGGSGGKTPMALTRDGVTELFAQNVLGHAVLLETVLRSGQLTQTAVFVGSEGARGVPKMGIKRPTASSLEEFTDILTGKAYAGKKLDIFSAYGEAKYIGALWMSSLARKYPNIRLLTVSPGGTKGTEAAKALPGPMRFFYNYIFTPVLAPPLGLVHSLETGSRRIANGLTDDSLLSGHFYASKAIVLTGPLVDQSELYANLADAAIQDRAAEAVSRFAA